MVGKGPFGLQEERVQRGGSGHDPAPAAQGVGPLLWLEAVDDLGAAAARAPLYSLAATSPSNGSSPARAKE